MSKNLATLIGLSAILQWSSIVGLLKKISFSIGPDLAVLMMYSLSTLLLLAVFGVPKLKTVPKFYLLSAAALFLVYEICFAYAVALAQTAQQAIEISLVNYLWPSMTIAMLILFHELKFHSLVVVGLSISLAGIFYIQTGNGDIHLATVIHNIQANPTSYILAFIGASLWSLYCVFTKKYSQGHNPIVFFFAMVSVVLWSKTLLLDHEQLPQLLNIDLNIMLYMLLVSIVTGLGYAAWNIGINQGNIAMLVALSYFSPIFSSVISMWVLNTSLSHTFWIGTMMVTLGSFICWLSTNWDEIRGRLFPGKLYKT